LIYIVLVNYSLFGFATTDVVAFADDDEEVPSTVDTTFDVEGVIEGESHVGKDELWF